MVDNAGTPAQLWRPRTEGQPDGVCGRVVAIHSDERAEPVFEVETVDGLRWLLDPATAPVLAIQLNRAAPVVGDLISVKRF